MKFLALLGHEEDKDGQDVPLRTALLRTWDPSPDWDAVQWRTKNAASNRR